MSAPLAVGLDAVNLLHDRRGIGRYVRSLLHSWRTSLRGRVDVTLLVPHAFPQLISSRLNDQFPDNPMRVARRSRADRLGFDLVWYPWNGITWSTRVRSVVTIHDVWPLIESTGPNRRLAENRRRPFLRTAQSATHVLTDSYFSKAEIVKHLRIEPERIDVVHLGVDPRLLAARPVPAHVDEAARYVLFVGEAEARKDLATLVAAFAKLPERLRAQTALVVAGKAPPRSDAPAGVRVHYTGEIDDERLASLYGGAAAFAFPSRYEGFGLPVLEAMAYGVPVVASDAASVPEAGGDAALYFRAGDADDCAVALERVLTDANLGASLRARGRARAAEMSWDRCARATLGVFESVARRS